MELHISQKIRKQYQLDASLFSVRGNMLFSDFTAVRKFAHHWNLENPPSDHINALQLAASGLIHEVSHMVIMAIQSGKNISVFQKAIQSMEEKLGKAGLYSSLIDFVQTFPPSEVYRGRLKTTEYIDASTGERSNASILVEESMLLSLANENPANKALLPLFGISNLANPSSFIKQMEELEWFFNAYPLPRGQGEGLFSFLRRPFLHAPDNLEAQIDFILANWKKYLNTETIALIMRGKDFIREEAFADQGQVWGQAPSVVPVYGKEQATGSMPLGKSGFDAVGESARDYAEHQQFTPDTHWMPRVVLLAKNTYVWLDQLSKKYGRTISRLDQIPDKELEQMASWHINGLWLIGIWERSDASRKIKHQMGNHDATASAYALFDYQIASDLGGDQAWRDLHERATRFGIRLAGDMVPNHTGIFSKWVVEHPEYFIQTHEPPFPSYTFSGKNLSDNPNLEIRIEDGYYTKTDAAVVFQRIDKRLNNITYIYHGNDGTVMPWNDTAQLDMIKAEVREAVIAKIFDVARKFSIIRFDAAMTLAKKHFSRLWYPIPGSGGDIPSRASYSMTRDEFDSLFPVEFWREVVDRINQELPETLLLAEAFWFMEGYFVRTLGMHRVYNSAFMHMLKNEENEKYRDLITNTLEFEPDILKRYVNFMSNPDEETAIQQFGTGDKYFGVCILMNTLPGLPMFAHGQIEGFTEKYGMEYLRARYHETANEALLERHRREIFPLTGMRYLFSEVKHFHLFDYLDHQHSVNENVFAYINRHNHEKALILFNNTYDRANGYIERSVPRLPSDGSGKNTFSLSLGDALDLRDDDNTFYVLDEHISGLQYLYKGKDIHTHGFQWNLQGFEYRVFLSFDELTDHDGSIGQLHQHLQGQGTDNVKEALMRLQLSDIHSAFASIFDNQLIDALIKHLKAKKHLAGEENIKIKITDNFRHFATLVCSHENNPEASILEATALFDDSLQAFSAANSGTDLPAQNDLAFTEDTKTNTAEALFVATAANPYRDNTLVALLYLTLSELENLLDNPEHLHDFDTGPLMLKWPLQDILSQTGKSREDTLADFSLLKILLRYRNQIMCRESTVSYNQINTLLLDDEVRQFLGINSYKGVEYYSKEKLEQLVKWLFSVYYISLKKRRPAPLSAPFVKVKTLEGAQFYTGLLQKSFRAGYRMSALREMLTAENGSAD